MRAGKEPRQIAMLADTLWRWMKRLAGHAEPQAQQGQPVPDPLRIRRPDHTLRSAQAALRRGDEPLPRQSRRGALLDARAAGRMEFLGYLDRRRKAA